MAHDILIIPISIVTSESVFSIGGQILNNYRSLLKSDIGETVIYTRDWIFEKKGI